MKRFVERFGPWALVTGASSGIGEAFAQKLAAMGMNLVLVARRENRLRSLAVSLAREYSVSTQVVSADLSREDFMPPIERATANLQIGLLVNNAGIATNGRFLDNDLGPELAMLHINNRAPLILAHHFGRSMRKLGRGGMIFLSSSVAFSAVPLWSNYAASKTHDLVLAEGLAKELRQDGISVLALCPGATQTDFWPAGSKPLLPQQPSAVVDLALRKLGKRTTVVAGWTNSITAFSTRLLPRSWNATIFGWVIGGMLKGAKTSLQVRNEKAATSPKLD
jgi:short-subunit dehydrogenase